MRRCIGSLSCASVSRYELYKRWGQDDSEVAESYLLALSYAETAEAKRFQARLDAENEADARDKRSQDLGDTFWASVRQPIVGGGCTGDNDVTVNQADTSETESDPYDRLEVRAGTSPTQRRIGREAIAALVARRDQVAAGLPGSSGSRSGSALGENGGGSDPTNERAAAQRPLGGRCADEVTVLGLRLAVDLSNTGTSMVVGQRVETLEDVVALAQVYRDPRAETFRVLYLDIDSKVVGEGGIPRACPALWICL